MDTRPLKVGTDLETAETAKHMAVGLGASYIAELWRKFLYPVPYERTYNVGGTRVTVRVETAKDQSPGTGNAEEGR